MAATAEDFEEVDVPRSVLESVVIRFAGDSGDGMQLTGNQFTLATALAGNDLATFPDFPAEIRAPIGTTFGVSAFQINFGSRGIRTSGDALDVLVAMNPAALKANSADTRPGGLLIVDTGSFTKRNLVKAGYGENPLTDNSLEKYKVLEIDMSRLTKEAVKEIGLSTKDGLRCKNMWALGLIYWMYGRKRKPTVDWLNTKFQKLPAITLLAKPRKCRPRSAPIRSRRRISNPDYTERSPARKQSLGDWWPGSGWPIWKWCSVLIRSRPLHWSSTLSRR